MNATPDAQRERERSETEAELRRIFVPRKPTSDPELFAGREGLLDICGDWIDQGVSGLVLYGQSGVGKTSFWKVLLHRKRIIRHSASKTSDFVTIFGSVLRGMGANFTDTEMRKLQSAGYDIGQDVLVLHRTNETEVTQAPVDTPALDPDFVLSKLETVAKSYDAIVIDEFHNVVDGELQVLLLQLIKGLSDRAIPITVVISGTAAVDTDLLRDQTYPALVAQNRHIMAQLIPPMTKKELIKIIRLREKRGMVRFEDEVRESIADLACGRPAAVHNLALTGSLIAMTQFYMAKFREAMPRFNRLFDWLQGGRDVGRPSSKPADAVVGPDQLRPAVDAYRTSLATAMPDTNAQFQECEESLELMQILEAVSSAEGELVEPRHASDATGQSLSDVESLLIQRLDQMFIREGDAIRFKSPQAHSFVLASLYMRT